MNARIWPCLAFLSLFVAAGCAQSPPSSTAEVLPAKSPGRYVEKVTVGGIEREFVLRVPRAYDATRRLPAVILLHGWTGTATQMETTSRFGDKAEKEGFFLVAPQGLGNSPGWNVGWLDLSFRKQDEIAFLNKVLDRVEKEVGVDPTQVFVVGHSNGGMLAHLAGSQMANRIAAIGVVAGTIGLPARSGQSEKLIPNPASPLSVILVHGKKDTMVGYDTKAKAMLVGVGAAEAAKWWAEKVGASQEAKVTRSSNGNITTELYTGGRNGSEVMLVSIENGSHDWPGGFARQAEETLSGIKATDLIWDFFKAHPKKP